MSDEHNKWEKVAAEVDSEAAEEILEKPELEQLSHEELLAQLSALKAKDNENKDKLIRMQAEMENQRRRVKLDAEQAQKDTLKRFAGELLPVVDNLERSLEQKESADMAALLAGVDLTLKLFQSTLEKFAVKVIDPLEQQFDPHLHEAMSMQEHPEKAPGTVIAVLQKGYLLHDRLLRPAMVIVAKAPENNS
jgi:molecular chaperone GrpE